MHVKNSELFRRDVNNLWMACKYRLGINLGLENIKKQTNKQKQSNNNNKNMLYI